MVSSLPLNLCHVKKQTLIINRLYTFIHSIAITLLIYYRISSIFTHIQSTSSPLTPHLLIFISELTLSFIWLLSQAFLWRPVTRTVFPERLPGDDQLPAIDVFICTADPEKEPPVGVMNTVVSAMALNYPPEKLSVYLSDDGGCSVTLEAMREAWKFGKLWVPFCRKYGVKTICPEAYFMEKDVDNEDVVNSDEFTLEKLKIKEEYAWFNESVTRIVENGSCRPNRDHYSVVEVIGDKSLEASTKNQRQMPLLVYVSREKRPSHPHHFKAGALNTLLRVSGVISNSAYILGLDCDMYCNDGNSARQAMCFHLDPDLSSSLAFVQFPQMFHNVSQHDIYETQLRNTFKTLWKGMDGVNGPCLSGTCYYMKREPLYGLSSIQEGINLMELKRSFGSSNEFIKSLHQKHSSSLEYGKGLSDEVLHEINLLASCEYEKDTKWGKEVGFRYFSVVEDYFTSFNLHCKDWISVFFNPPRPSFLGSGTTSLNDLLIQGTRWSAGLVEVGLSSFSPITYGPLRMSILHSMCYGWLALFPLTNFISIWILATIPQLCLLNGTFVYPEVRNPFFIVFVYVFISSHLQHMREILSTGESLKYWKYEQRVWMIKGITSHLYGSIQAIMEKLGAKEASFLPTNKVIDDEQVKLYEMGVYNFQTSSMFLVPLCSLTILNLIAFLSGIFKIALRREYDEIFAQTFLSFFVTMMGYPILEGMILRKDKGRIRTNVTCNSIVFCIVIMCLGSVVVMF